LIEWIGCLAPSKGGLSGKIEKGSNEKSRPKGKRGGEMAMILDHVENWRHYAALHPGFEEAFAFLERKDLGDLPAGRHPIEGERLYALVIKEDGRGRDSARLETHNRYIDIQFTVAGADDIGWKPAAQCAGEDQGYNAEKDSAFFRDKPEAWVTTLPGTFTIFFPEDAHAPLGGTGAIHKVVVKVALTTE
jgi:biofilm protein TabA